MSKDHPIGPAARRFGRALAGVARAAANEASGAPHQSIPVSRTGFEEQGIRWPLAVDHGHVIAEQLDIYFRAPDGTTYALNGPAREHHQPIDPIHLRDETVAQAVRDARADPDATRIPNISVAPLIRIGRQAQQ